MARTGFAAQVRAYLKQKPGAVSYDELLIAFDLTSPEEKRRMQTAIRDMIRSGELAQTGADRVYRYIDRDGRPEFREVMWRVLRSRRRVTADDLQELSGASRTYVREWLRMLERQGLVQRSEGNRFTLLEDAGPDAVPCDDAKAEKLRQIRDQKKAALASIDAALQTILQARLAVSEIREEEPDASSQG